MYIHNLRKHGEVRNGCTLNGGDKYVRGSRRVEDKALLDPPPVTYSGVGVIFLDSRCAGSGDDIRLTRRNGRGPDSSLTSPLIFI